MLIVFGFNSHQDTFNLIADKGALKLNKRMLVFPQAKIKPGFRRIFKVCVLSVRLAFTICM